MVGGVGESASKARFTHRYFNILPFKNSSRQPRLQSLITKQKETAKE